MKVTEVKYRANWCQEDDPYKHTHVEVTVAVGDEDTPEEALAYAEYLVKRKLGLIKTMSELRWQNSDVEVEGYGQ